MPIRSAAVPSTGSVRASLPVPGRSGPAALLAMVAIAAACSQSATTTDDPPIAEPVVPPQPACTPGSRNPLLSFPGRVCPWELVANGNAARLRSLDPDPVPVVGGELPEECGATRCMFEGVESSVGPLVLAVLPSPESEMPAGTWLGAVIGERLRFVDLWEGAGGSVFGDGTPLGPAHALAPHDCGGALGLLVVDRLDAGEGLPPAAPLIARQGRVIADGELGVEIEPAQLGGCVPVEGLSLP